MKFPDEAKELVELLVNDQKAWQAYSSAEFEDRIPHKELQKLNNNLRINVAERGERALEILNKIGNLPSLDNIGFEAAVALSVLATHYSLDATKQVLSAFEECYKLSPKNTQVTSIPAMTDWVAVLEHRPQKFGTIWLFDSNNYPFLPTVEDFENVNERRKSYGIGPLRWPKSLALSETAQPWLKKPLTEAVMRTPTAYELQKFSEQYS